MKVAAIVQARMASIRLPGKVLMDIKGVPMLMHIINRLKFSRLIDEVIVATSTNKKDSEIEEFCRKFQTTCYRGSEDNIAERIAVSFKQCSCDAGLRVWGDCPLIDPFVIDEGIEMFVKEGADYLSNFFPEKSYPYGLDFEIYSGRLFKDLEKEEKSDFFKEFPFEFVWENKVKYKTVNLKNKENLLEEASFTVDYPQDLELMKKIYEELYSDSSIFTYKEAIEFLRKNSHLKRLNRNLARNIEYNAAKLKQEVI
ncbi:MAG: glycosyltransferase family protein [Candidatus Omnitrophota bacterium]